MLATLTAITAATAVAKDEIVDASGAAYDWAAGAWFAVADKIHVRHLAGAEANIQAHFRDLAGNGPPGKDPEKWADQWKRDIARAIRGMRSRVERIKSRADKARWQERIDELQNQLDSAE